MYCLLLQTLFWSLQTTACHVSPVVADIILERAINSLSCVACCCRHSEHSGARKQQLVMYCLLLQTLFWSMQTTACHVLPIVPDIILERANNSMSCVTCCCRHSQDSVACKQQLVMCCLLFQTLFWSVQTTACHVSPVVADILNILEHANNSLSCIAYCCRHCSGACKQLLVMYCLLFQILFWSVQTTACHVLPVVADIILERANNSLSCVTCCCRHYSGACKQQLVMCCLLLLQTL